MEPLKITHMELDDNPDLGELYLLVNSDEPRPAVSYLVDDERNFYLRVAPDSGEIVGASALFANDWFQEIAQAFQQRDLNHPDVHFFLQQKINVLAKRLPQEIQNLQVTLAPQETTEPQVELAGG